MERIRDSGLNPFTSYFSGAETSSVVDNSANQLYSTNDITGPGPSPGADHDRMLYTHAPSSGWDIGGNLAVYRPGFSEVLLNAANILESRSGSRVVSEGFASPALELSQSGGPDSMPVLLSHIKSERSPCAELNLIVKSELRGLKSSSSMPCLTPEDNDADLIRLPSFIEEPASGRPHVCSVKKDLSEIADVSETEEVDCSDWVAMSSRPFNMRLVNLNNFPATQTLYRANYRSHSTACVRARMGSIQNTAKSLDLMRSLLQKSINKEIDLIIQKYTEDFFHPAVENIRLNNGDNSVSDEHMQTVCRQILEEAKKMYSTETRSVTPLDLADMSDAGSQAEGKPSKHSQLLLQGLRGKRERRLSSGSESSSRSQTGRIKKKPRPLLQGHGGGSGRSTPSRSTKPDPVKRQGPSWDPSRLKPDVELVMGSKANKALGLGATRGRLYIKHPHIFKYSGDQDDKQWLHENHHMPATGGRTYLLLVDDIRELAETDEYRNSGALLLEELVGFTVPGWMLEKMKLQMQSMRTDLSRPSKLIHDATALIGLQGSSPANAMSPEREDEDKLNTSVVSPLNETVEYCQEEIHNSSGETFYNYPV